MSVQPLQSNLSRNVLLVLFQPQLQVRIQVPSLLQWPSAVLPCSAPACIPRRPLSRCARPRCSFPHAARPNTRGALCSTRSLRSSRRAAAVQSAGPRRRPVKNRLAHRAPQPPRPQHPKRAVPRSPQWHLLPRVHIVALLCNASS